MTENLVPSEQAELVHTYEGEVALFDDPQRLLRLGDGEWAGLAAAVRVQARGQAAQMRRVGGLMAWAGAHRLAERMYGKWLAGLAEDFGVSVVTVHRWRQGVIDSDGLAVPALMQANTDEKKAGHQTRKSRSEPSLNQNDSESEPTPAPEPETFAQMLAPPSPAKPEPFTLGSLLGYLKTWDSSTLRELPAAKRATLLPELQRWLVACGEGVRTTPVGAQAPILVRSGKRTEGVSKKDCPHPVTRRLGTSCAQCGASNVGKK